MNDSNIKQKPKKRSNKKYFLYIIIIVLLLVIINFSLAYFSRAKNISQKIIVDGSIQTIDSETYHQIDTMKIEDKIFTDINQIRASAGLDMLKNDKDLKRLAKNHSQDMFDRGYYDHIDPDGLDATGRAIKNDIPIIVRFPGGRYVGLGENIGGIYLGNDADCQTYNETILADCLVKKWMDSVEHKSNILDHYTVTGIGIACNVTKCYGTQDFR